MKFVPLCLIIVLQCACSQPRRGDLSTNETTYEELQSYASIADLPQYSRNIGMLSLQGDAAASTQLLLQIEDCISRGKRSPNPQSAACNRVAFDWALVGAENGDMGSMSVVFNHLSESKSCTAIIRSKFWLNRLAELDPKGPWRTDDPQYTEKINQCTHSFNASIGKS